jgi:hypothetical protein
MNRLLIASLVLTGLLTAGVASAGYKADYQVYVNTSSMIAIGALGSARNSGDSNQYIGCINEAYSSGSQYIVCYAANSSGSYGSCTSTDPHFMAVAQSVAGDSFLEFSWNSSGTTFIEVNSTSYYPPKQP